MAIDEKFETLLSQFSELYQLCAGAMLMKDIDIIKIRKYVELAQMNMRSIERQLEAIERGF